MAWGETVPVGDFAALKNAIDNASNGDVIEMTADITYTTNGQAASLLNIKKSITLDGKGHSLFGYGKAAVNADGTSESHLTALAINASVFDAVNAPTLNVRIQNLTLGNIKNEFWANGTQKSMQDGSRFYGLSVYDGVASLTMDNVNILVGRKNGNNNTNSQPGGAHQMLLITGINSTPLDLTITNSRIYAGESKYPVYILKPIDATLKNSTFEGYSALYFKYRATSWLYGNTVGTRGSVVEAENCDFNAPNVHNGYSNDFAVFACEDDGITLNLHNCGMNAQQLGNAGQDMVSAAEYATRRELNININITGDNSHINGNFVCNNWNFKFGEDGTAYEDTEIYVNGYWQKWNKTKGAFDTGYESELAFPAYTGRVNITIQGGTYAINPDLYRFNGHLTSAEDLSEYEQRKCTIPEGYEVKTITLEGVATPLYRVVKKAAKDGSGDPLYDLNDNVETAGAGQNPFTSFELSDGSDMTLNQQVTKAGYVQVMDNGDDATTVTVGKDSGTDKDQKLIINNGLDVQGKSKVEVKVGSTLEIGEGGIVTEKPENIVIGANENGAASLIMDPTITVNQTPNLTVKMKAKSIGWMNGVSAKEYYWHRFALPIQQASTWVKNPNKSTYVFGWNYSNDNWEQLSALTQMVPFKGYTLSADYENLGDVEYTFTGQLAGNTNNLLEFERNGFNFFGNSYTGYIDILALVEQIMGDNKIDGSVWVWGGDQNYHVVPLLTLRDGGDVYATEIAPMQTFILKQNGSENASAELNYASAVWGNPRYGHSVTPAPSRNIADETTRMRIIVTAENGKSDFVMFTEDAKFSDSFEKGYDGEKYMNENALNMFATVNGANYTAIATDNLEGKMITINTVEAVNYTMSFAKVNGEEYAIRDNATGKVIAIQEGATYEFAAQPNSTVEGRFQIVMRDKVTTAIENTEVKANVKGIYTLMGQYVGEDFNTLPAGVYVVDGVKIVK